MTRRATCLLLLMGILAAIYNIFLPAHPDEAYYWQWSRHLALSYFDGPPLMAYLIRCVTTVFGVSAWSIKFTAVLCMTVTAYILYRLARELFDEKTAWLTLLIFLFLPLTQTGYVISTLDPALVLCWSLTLYWFYLAVSRDKNCYRYLASIALGLTVLAKYSGVLLGVGLLLHFLTTRYRRQLSNINWYLAGLLALLVFSPVLIWNWQHQWVSFIFQYTHGVAEQKVFQWSLLLTFVISQLAITNPIFLIAALYFSFRYGTKIITNRNLLYLAIPFWLTFLFFTYQGMFKFAEANWAAPAYLSATILVAYFIGQFRLKVLYFITGLNVLLLIFIRFPITTPFLPDNLILLNRFLGYQEMIAQAATEYKLNDIVVSGTHQDASEVALYLPGHPQTYIIDNSRAQYAMWSAPLKAAILAGEIKSVLYIGDPEQVSNLKIYFKHQQFIKNLDYYGRWNSRHWVMVRAWN